MKMQLVALLALGWCGTCDAQFLGPSAFTAGPSSSMGALTNNLVLTDTATGFVVSGQVLINIPAGAVSGILATWTVDRPLDPLFGTATMTTTTTLTGFSLPPIGTFAPTVGQAGTLMTNPGIISQSLVPLSLVNGFDVPAWTSLSVTSSSFLYTSGGFATMQQRFILLGNQLSGPGGIWTVDVPLFSDFSVVPEPGSILLSISLITAAGLGVRRLRQRSH